jgi:hypothetical protein
MLDDIRLHAHLIGKAGSRDELNTPALVVDHDALARNVQKMAAIAQRAGVALRPHAKSHKSLAIARLQLEAGAVGLCCAKLGEAEVFAAGGVESLLITSPVVSKPAIERLVALNARIPDLMVCVDNPANVAALAAAARGRQLRLLIDVDPGIRRTGVGSAESAVALLKAIHATCAPSSRRSSRTAARRRSSAAPAPARITSMRSSGCSQNGRSVRTCSWTGNTPNAISRTTRRRHSSTRCSSMRAS